MLVYISVSLCSRTSEVAVVETNGKDQDHDRQADVSDGQSKTGTAYLCILPVVQVRTE